MENGTFPFRSKLLRVLEASAGFASWNRGHLGNCYLCLPLMGAPQGPGYTREPPPLREVLLGGWGGPRAA